MFDGNTYAADNTVDALALTQVVDNTVVVHLQARVEQLSFELLFAAVLEHHGRADKYPAQSQNRQQNTCVKRKFNPPSHNRNQSGR